VTTGIPVYTHIYWHTHTNALSFSLIRFRYARTHTHTCMLSDTCYAHTQVHRYTHARAHTSTCSYTHSTSNSLSPFHTHKYPKPVTAHELVNDTTKSGLCTLKCCSLRVCPNIMANIMAYSPPLWQCHTHSLSLLSSASPDRVTRSLKPHDCTSS
jgi:hypothetical protein